MSIEHPGESSEPTPSEENILNELKLELLQDDRPVHVLADEEPGTKFLLGTTTGVLEFTVKAWGEQDEIEPCKEVFAEITIGKELTGGRKNVAILGPSEGGVLGAKGSIKQYSELSIASLDMMSLTEEDRLLPDYEYEEEIRMGRVIRLEQGGSFRLNQGPAQVIPAVLFLIRQPIEEDQLSTPIFMNS